MAKKKKSQLKPVARGFATTSVPKKPVVVDEASTRQDADQSNGFSQVSGEDHKDGFDPVGQSDANELDEARFEEQRLQDFVDKFQEKIEKEISRTIKTIEFDRRLSQTFPRIDLDSTYQESIIDLVTKYQPDNVGNASIDETEEKALPRLGITYGVLRRLGFSEDRVMECLQAIPGIDLDEAFEWLYLHCSEDELYDKPLEPRTPRLPRSAAPPQSTFSLPSPSIPDKSYPELLSSSLKNGFSDSSDRDAHKMRALVSNEFDASSLSPSASSDDEVDDPNIQYAKVKARLAELDIVERQKHDNGSNSLRAKLEARLKSLKANYFFRSREAEALYSMEKTRLNQKLLEQRLSAKIEDSVMLDQLPAEEKFSKNSHSRPHSQSQEKVNGTPTVDIFDDGYDSSVDDNGGVFGFLLDTMPISEVTDGVDIQIRNMALPKHWAGRTPKRLLLETVQKVDRHAVISYRTLPDVQTSRSKRAAVTVRWDGPNVGEWCMDEVGCWDEVQAEQYVSTVALHDITFGHSEGFAGGSSGVSGGSGQTYFRLLPPVFRDLWDELECKRKESEDRANRNTWASLRRIIGPKLGYDRKLNKTTLSQLQDTAPRLSASDCQATGDDIKSRFLARQASIGYQLMLPQRNNLPIAHYRDEIISTLESSQVMVLSGETGCGKSTQLPAYILEDHLSRGKHCKIYCTEPRRISAISLAHRVALELGDPPGSVGTSASLVGYTIRLESNTTRNTRLAFVTNGIALRMLEGGSGSDGQGTAFDEITHIIIDEVHERNLDSDFLLIVLKSLMEQRRDLKIVLMSATMDAQKVSNFFGGCPILHVPGRTFPVDVRFLEDAIEYTGWSIKEGSLYAKRLGDKYYQSAKLKDWSEDAIEADEEDEAAASPHEMKLEKRYSPATKSTVDILDERLIPYDLIVRLLERLCFEDMSSIHFSAAILVFMPGLAEIRRLHDMLSDHPLFGIEAGFRILPLHSTISSDNQAAVFDVLPPGVRKIVISTNIAETGVTIPDITCVIDSGKHREMRFDEKRQISRLIETFIAKSNAAQRRGRAGRVQPGICFHLFTKARHDHQMADNPLPEMLRLSLSDLALRIKILKVKIGNSIEDVLSQALDPPLEINVQRAVQALVEVKALTPTQDITPMGRLLSKLPTDVHIGKFLLIAAVFGCLDPALTIAAALNSKSPFVTPFGLEHDADKARRSFQSDNSDFLTIHNAFSSWRRASANPTFVRKFCKQNFLSHQNLQQIEELRQQFLGYLIDSGFIQVPKAFVTDLSRARYGRNKVRFVNVPAEFDRNSHDHALLNGALLAGLYPKVLTIDPLNGQIRTVTNNQPVSFHPSSVNIGKKSSDFGVNYLCYFTIMQSKKLYAWETGPVDNMALVLLCGDCESKLASTAIMLDRKIRFRLSAKACVALKHLREQFTTILGLRMRRIPLSEAQESWYSLALTVLGKPPFEVSVTSSGPSLVVHTA
ncbi:P-loop containing nucleoside triphosphate hydrolase protein [Hysterangium stoloniferum]|nr:P-loop containing nucleoside triphosphate hydrolase protein [Hysterangium stoloniferum]